MADYDYTDVNTGEDLYESQLEERFDDFFNEVYPEVEFGELTYLASRVLGEVDPIAYREVFNNWIDAEVREGNYREYVEPECDACDATLTQDEVTEALSVYGKMICPDCVEDDDEE